jgi:MFS transporter, FHS family, L-fucose permease
MGTEKKRLFIGPDGANLVFTFILVSSLFFLWGVCNGMIDVMDKHFQEELNLNKAQSAWVQFAHYLGYFLMAMPAGWLAVKLGYKGGIIAGLLLVAVGGFWFIPLPTSTPWSTKERYRLPRRSSDFCLAFASSPPASRSSKPSPTPTPPCWATRDTPPRASISRNPAMASAGSSAPAIGSVFFYSKDAAGHSTGSQTLYIPYVTIAAWWWSSPSSSISPASPTSKLPTITTLTIPRREFRIPSGRIRISCWPW